MQAKERDLNEYILRAHAQTLLLLIRLRNAVGGDHECNIEITKLMRKRKVSPVYPSSHSGRTPLGVGSEGPGGRSTASTAPHNTAKSQ